MAHTITWQRGDGKTLYQPATDDERMWISNFQGFAFEVHEWSRDGVTRPLIAASAPGVEVPTIQLEPKLYRWKWRALWVARAEEKDRAKKTLTEVREVKGS